MKTKALGEICRPKQWKTVSVSQLCENGYPVYGANGVIGKYKDFNHKKETILVTCRGATCGTLNICAPFSYVNGNAMALDSLDKSVDLRYLYYFLKGRGFHDVISGSAQPQIIRSAIERIEVPICNIGTQKEITKRFTKIEDIIKNKKRLLADLDNLIKARFVEMFGDGFETTELRNICRVTSGGTPSTKNSDYYNGTIPWVTTTALGPNHIDDTKAKAYISEEAVANSATKIIPSGSILFGIRVGVGKTSINDVDICTNQDIVAILDIDEKKFSKLFIKHVLDANRAHYDSLKKGATILGITSDDLKNTPIPLVPIKAQKDFEVFVTQVDKSKFTLQNSIISLMNLWYNINQYVCERMYGEA